MSISLEGLERRVRSLEVSVQQPKRFKFGGTDLLYTETVPSAGTDYRATHTTAAQSGLVFLSPIRITDDIRVTRVSAMISRSANTDEPICLMGIYKAVPQISFTHAQPSTPFPATLIKFLGGKRLDAVAGVHVPFSVKLDREILIAPTSGQYFVGYSVLGGASMLPQIAEWLCPGANAWPDAGSIGRASWESSPPAESSTSLPSRVMTTGVKALTPWFSLMSVKGEHYYGVPEE